MEILYWFSLVGGAFVQQLPYLLVIGAGLIFSFSKLDKYPKAAKFSLIGLAILFVTHFAGLFLPAIFTQVMMSNRDNMQTIGFINLVIGFVFSLAGAVGLGLVIYAAWMGRNSE